MKQRWPEPGTPNGSSKVAQLSSHVGDRGSAQPHGGRVAPQRVAAVRPRWQPLLHGTRYSELAAQLGGGFAGGPAGVSAGPMGAARPLQRGPFYGPPRAVGHRAGSASQPTAEHSRSTAGGLQRQLVGRLPVLGLVPAASALASADRSVCSAPRPRGPEWPLAPLRQLLSRLPTWHSLHRWGDGDHRCDAALDGCVAGSR